MSAAPLPRSQRHQSRQSRIPRLLGWLVAAGFVGFVTIAVLAYAWVRAFLAGEEFRALLAGRLGETLGTEVELAPLRWERLAVHTDSVQAAQGKGFAKLKLEEAQAAVSLQALTSGVWIIENARIEKATLDFKLPNATPTIAAAPAVQPAPTDAPPESSAYTLPAWFPTTVKVPELLVRETNLRFGHSDLDVRIVGSALQLKHRDAEGFDFMLRGGTFRLAPFPGAGIADKTFSITEANGQLTPDTVFLLGSTLTATDQTTLTLDGTLPGRNESGTLDIHYRMDGLPVSQVLGPEWTDRILGKLSIDGRTHSVGEEIIHEGQAELAQARFFTPATSTPKLDSLPPAVSAAINNNAAASALTGIANNGLSLVGNTLIPLLGAYTDRTMQYRNLFCDTARCHFKKSSTRIELTQIDIRSRGLLGIQGSLNILGRDLDGQLLVGLSREALTNIPGAESDVFTIERDGLVWTTVRVSGTIDSPVEDLSQRIIAAAGKRVMQAVPGLEILKQPEQLLENTKSLLPDTAGELLDSSSRLLDRVVPRPALDSNP